MGTFSNLLRENMFKPQDVPAFQNKLFFEGARRRPYLEQFGALLFLATVIATMGVIGDSTATVIGAMIVAPLMTPIMATAAALVMGQMGRAIRASLIVAVGVVGVLVLSWLLGTLYLTTGFLSFETNSQITARISPRLIDLLAALASGAAGAFCMSRDDIADSLPGVAISISLVPPLCVVGVGLSAGEFDAALGALLLFLTNYLSILLAGGGVLALLGLGNAATKELTARVRRNAFVAITIGVFLVTAPLIATGLKIAKEGFATAEATRVTREWVGGTDFLIQEIRVAGNRVYVLITGAGAAPPFDELVSELQAAIDPAVAVDLEMVPSEKQSHTVQAVD